MTNTPSKAEIEALVKRHGATSYRNRADTQHPAHGFTEDGLNGLIDEVLAKWGTQPQAGAVPQGWKAVPVNPTPEMWKAAKTVPDPNPSYPPHYGLVWDAMLAASPTPPAEQAAPKAAPQQEAQEPVMIYHGRCTIDCGEHGHHDMEMLRMIPAGSKLYTAPQPAPAPLSDDDLVELGKSGKSGLHPWGVGTTRADYLRAVRAVLDAALAAPQPAPAPLSDDVVKDAARYRWLREGNDAKHGAAWHVAVNLYGCEWDAAIDAAIAAQGGKA